MALRLSVKLPKGSHIALQWLNYKPMNRLTALSICLGFLLFVYGVYWVYSQIGNEVSKPKVVQAKFTQEKNNRRFDWHIEMTDGGKEVVVEQLQPENHYQIDWISFDPNDTKESDQTNGPLLSNIRQSDYQGPDSCKSCHETNYNKWYDHPHRRMNAYATAKNVVGDFSGDQVVHYQEGEATFYQIGSDYYMKLKRDPITRVFLIKRTVGSRFFQSYAGILVEGPEPEDSPMRKIPHHLPFSFWIEKGRWVPEVHIHEEKPDAYRIDCFGDPGLVVPYDQRCGACHITWAMGDWMVNPRGIDRIVRHAPWDIRFAAFSYLLETNPDLVDFLKNSTGSEVDKSDESPVEGLDAIAVFDALNKVPAPERAITLGISCEACHLGGADHIKQSTEFASQQKPCFYPRSEQVSLGLNDHDKTEHLSNPENINWICARCHTGKRPKFAAGISTWNSVEATDAFHGFCYSHSSDTPTADSPSKTLDCLACHDPHEAIGKKWKKTPAQDDQVCMSCHTQFQDSKVLATHTHHASESSGSRCMNCHMPKINEGLQDIVRTHTIFNPTNSAMIEANQPNACNLCHLDKPIDWTLNRLEEWYGTEWNEDQISSSYPNREDAVGLGWLDSPHESTRLVAIEALAKSNSLWALDELVEALNDPFLINREFAQANIERLLDIDLVKLGYLHYAAEEQRLKAIKRLQEQVKVEVSVEP